MVGSPGHIYYLSYGGLGEYLVGSVYEDGDIAYLAGQHLVTSLERLYYFST